MSSLATSMALDLELPWLAISLHGLTGALGALIALLLGRWGVQRLLFRLRANVRESECANGAIAFASTGWRAFDSLVFEFDRLARLRALRIDALARQEARFRALADSTHSVEAWFDRAGSLVWVNRSIEKLVGYSRAECLLAGNLIDLLVPEKDRVQMESFARAALRGEGSDELELQLVCKDASLRWVACHWRAMKSAEGRALGVRLSVEDIQERKDAQIRLLDTVASLQQAQALQEHYLQRSEDERLRLVAVLDALRAGILFVDRDRRIYHCNQALRDMWGLAREENLAGQRDTDLIERTAALRMDNEAYLRHLEAVLKQRGSSLAYEIPLVDGRVFEEVSALVGSEDGARYIGRVWIFEDITERKLTAQQLVDLAERDTLTGLFNRRRFLEEIERMIAEAARRADHMALVYFDLDGFKAVNDRFGHAAGDRVLVAVADTVAATVRRNELLFRLGGDEFAVLVPAANRDEVVTLAHRILLKIRASEFDCDEGKAHVGVSLGVAFFPNHAATPQGLLEAADAAMYRAKAAGRNTVVIYGEAGSVSPVA